MAMLQNTATTADEYDRINNVIDGEVKSWISIYKFKEELICKMKKSINELERSQFYHDYHEEVQRKPISKGIHSVLGLESKMQMVIYGIGSISNEENESPKWQLSLAILMKDFNWIRDVEVFDPILSEIDIQVLESFGCRVLSINEHGRRQVLKPTMFFMPHCDVDLYNNLLEANWERELLSNVVIFGNSFASYIEDFAIMSRLFHSNDRKRKVCTALKRLGHILAAQKFISEFEMRRISYDPTEIDQYADPCGKSFSDVKWHFFNPHTTRRTRLMRENAMN